jgi:hypothetical protein
MNNFKLYNIKKNIKLYGILSVLTIASLSGCEKKDTNINNSTENITTTEYIQQTTTEIATEYVEPTTIEVTTETTTENIINTEEIQESKDAQILSYFDKKYRELQEAINNTDAEEIRKKGKELFITFADFIFYDKEIYGITYDELSDGVKEQIYNDFSTIDSLVEEYSPGYKDDLADKYNTVKDFVSPYYYQAIDKIKEAIGNDNLEVLDDYKNTAKEDISELYEDSKETVKILYENWKKK